MTTMTTLARVALLAAGLGAGCTARGAVGRARIGDAPSRSVQAAAAPEPTASPAGAYASVNGLQIYYEVHGAAHPETAPLILLHGGGSTIETSFGRTLPLLAKTRRIIAFEQQGHGRTADIAERAFTFEQSADDAAALVEHLGIVKADFFGYSNGGNVALRLAMRRPDLVRRLVVASAMFRRDGLPPEFWTSMEHARLENMPAELQDAYRRVAPHPEQLQSMHDKCVERMLAFADWLPQDLRAIEAPTLVMVGDSDVVRPEHAVEMFRLLPHAQLAVLPGTDHMKLVQRAEWQVALIEAFLDAETPAR